MGLKQKAEQKEYLQNLALRMLMESGKALETLEPGF